jgi:hypothetical protein
MFLVNISSSLVSFRNQGRIMLLKICWIGVVLEFWDEIMQVQMEDAFHQF